MNIYIPDIKLPKDEPGAFKVIVMYVGADGKLRAECEGTHEVISVPPHGRLIDADALKNTVYEALKDAIHDDNATPCGAALCAFIAKHIVAEKESAPTIIPASGKEEQT